MDRLTIPEQVSFLAESFFMRVDDLCSLCLTMDHFPLTAKQIRAHYQTPIAMVRGNLRARNKHLSKPMPSPSSPPLNPNRRLEPKRLSIGHVVGTDGFGPVANRIANLFKDQASGFVRSTYHKWSLRKEISAKFETTKRECNLSALKWCVNMYRKHGHTITTLRHDGLPAYNGHDFKTFCQDHDINQDPGPPGQHWYNGSAEASIKTLSYMVTGILDRVRYYPVQLWTKAWDYAEIILNLRLSCIPESRVSRWEEFTHQRPDYRTMVILPFGQAVEYFIPTEQRAKEGKYCPHSRLGMYCGPKLETSERGAIWIWCPATKSFVSSDTYRIMRELPATWVPLNQPTFDELLDPLGPRPAADFDSLQPYGHDDTLPLVPVLPAPTSSFPQLSSRPLPSRQPRPMSPDDPLYWPRAHTVPAHMATTSEGAHEPPPFPVSTTPDPISVPVDIAPPRPVMLPSEGAPSQPAALEPPLHVPDLQTGPLPIPMQPSEGGRPRRSNAGSYRDGPARLRRITGRMRTKLRSAPPHFEVYIDDTTLQAKVTEFNQAHQVIRGGGVRLRIVRTKDQQDRAVISKLVRSTRRHWDNPTLKQAMAREDWPQWQAAIKTELQQMVDEGVYDDKDYRGWSLPRGATVIGSMFTLVIKRNKTTNRIEKYKARLVALGNQQGPNSYDKVSSGTARNASVKLLVAIQAKTGAHSMVLDVKGAYLKTPIQESRKELLWVKLPDGRLVKLRKYLYGLRQAGAMWQENISGTLLAHGYTPTADPQVYVKRTPDDFVMMSLHVDDFYVISSHQHLLDSLYNTLISTYNEVSKKSNNVLEYLGMSVQINDNGSVTISQPSYIDKMLAIAGLSQCNPSSTPMAVAQSTNDEYSQTTVDKTNYLQLVGLINYLAIYTRPDLLYSLSRVAQACSDPRESDLRRVKRILRYINTTKHFGITYNRDEDFQLYCFVDASFNCYTDGKSHYGYAFSLGRGNGTFYAKSSKIRIVTLSSTESEYVALCNAVTEVVYLQKLLQDLGFPQRNPTVIFEDNISCIEMVYNELKHKTTKHINNKYHFTKDMIRDNKITIEYLATSEMVADILTKPLYDGQHHYLTAQLLNQHR